MDVGVSIDVSMIEGFLGEGNAFLAVVIIYVCS